MGVTFLLLEKAFEDNIGNIVNLVSVANSIIMKYKR